MKFIPSFLPIPPDGAIADSAPAAPTSSGSAEVHATLKAAISHFHKMAGEVSCSLATFSRRSLAKKYTIIPDIEAIDLALMPSGPCHSRASAPGGFLKY